MVTFGHLTWLIKGKNNCSWHLRFSGSRPSFCSRLLLLFCSKSFKARRACIRIKESEEYCYSKCGPQFVDSNRELVKNAASDLLFEICILRNPQGITMYIEVCHTLLFERWKMSWLYLVHKPSFSPPNLVFKIYFSPS